jgi:uncharacterized YigZ family protein
MNPKADSAEEDSYISIAGHCSEIYRVKGSRFIAFAWPVSCEPEIKKHIETLRKEYFDATHHCYAWSLGKNREKNRSHDDGEPAGTAGKPIYGQILSAGYSDVLVAVVRYFGGTKLGTSGLTDAYKLAAKHCLENSTPRQAVLENTFDLAFPYERMNEVMRLIKDMALPVVNPDFSTECRLTTKIRLGKQSAFREAANKIDRLQVVDERTSAE